MCDIEFGDGEAAEEAGVTEQEADEVADFCNNLLEYRRELSRLKFLRDEMQKKTIEIVLFHCNQINKPLSVSSGFSLR